MSKTLRCEDQSRTVLSASDVILKVPRNPVIFPDKLWDNNLQYSTAYLSPSTDIQLPSLSSTAVLPQNDNVTLPVAQLSNDNASRG